MIWYPAFIFRSRLVDLLSGHGDGLGDLDFFDPIEQLTEEIIEKWWCLGTDANRYAVWVQGNCIH